MTFLNTSSGDFDSSYLREIIRSIGRWLFGLVNTWVAATIARRERQAALAVLRISAIGN